jgi:NAD(P)-dependent dehydrogenase (short-subunit alcohol dehydrogenase family)
MTRSRGRQSIFITGAASGMGRATARLFAGQGWFVGAYDVDPVGLVSLEQELGADNGLFAVLDVTDREAWFAAVAGFGQATGGKLDLLFNNAGIGVEGLFDEIAWDDVLKVVGVNLLGVMNGIQAATPLLKATPGSLCLTNSSSSSIWGTDGLGVYSATKHAVRGLTEALSVEFQRFGGRAADLLPGLIDTPLLGDNLRALTTPDGMWRLVPPEEVAEAVLAAYHGNQVHWYVPAELKEFDLMATSAPEMVRDERARLFGFVPAQVS